LIRMWIIPIWIPWGARAAEEYPACRRLNLLKYWDRSYAVNSFVEEWREYTHHAPTITILRN